MAINFKRELFRIWLALSLLWIGLTGRKEYYNKPWNMDWGPGWRVGDECRDRLAKWADETPYNQRWGLDVL